MGTCFDPQVNCDTCFEVLIGDCLSDIDLSLGLSPSALFFFRLIDKFGATYDFTATTDVLGDFTVPKDQLPDDLINQFAGLFILEVYSDSGRTELVNIVQNSITYDCVILTQELSGSNQLTPPDVFSNLFSFDFNGTDRFINIDPIQVALASTTVGTWSVWVKPVDATPPTDEFIIAFGDTNGNECVDISVTPTGRVGGRCRTSGANQWVFTSIAVVFSDDTWTHIMIVQNGVSPVVYVNGSLVTLSFTITLDETAWFNSLVGLDNGRIACRNQNSGGNLFFLEGNVDEALFVNRALTATQAPEVYNNGTPKDQSETANGVAYLRMGDKGIWDGLEWTLPDQINSNNGTSVNAEFTSVEADVP